jgi:hypothetical protein
VGLTIRYRGAALDLASGWVDMGKIPLRKELRHEQRPGELSLSVSQARAGAASDYARLLEQVQAAERAWDAFQHSRALTGFVGQRRVLGVDSWEGPRSYCVGSRWIDDPPQWKRDWKALQAVRRCGRWTVSDGHTILRAFLVVGDEGSFSASVTDCHEMLRSVRFEGPN